MIVVDSVWKSFDRRAGDASPVLRDVSFTVQRSEMCALVGASGSGKSTLMNLVGLLDRPTKGDIEIDGVSTRLMPDRQVADVRSRTIGFVFQAFHLIPRMNAVENVALPLVYRGVDPDQRRERAKSLLSSLGLRDRLFHTPNELSGGQRQRVAIARALVGNPRLLLADEPTGSLDSVSSREVMEILKGIRRKDGTTIIIVTHDRDIAKSCDRQILIKDGEIVSDRDAALPGRSR